tara:strand:+ start:273 stop:650 length:378 start_codon:yes stop_codon:yes gene_type:complete
LSIDLDSTEGRKKYLTDKLDDLLDGINDSYGTLLMDELLSRLELTIKDFNEEMKTLCEELVSKEKERQQLLEMLKTTESIPPINIEKAESLDNNEEELKEIQFESNEIDESAPEWEKKLAKLEKK